MNNALWNIQFITYQIPHLKFASAQKFNGSCNTSGGGQAQASNRFHLQIEKDLQLAAKIPTS